MKTVTAVMLAILVCPAAAAVAQETQSPEVLVQWIRFHRVHLRNGNVIDGDLVGINDREALMKLGVGEMAIRRGQIEKIEFIKMRSVSEKPPVIIPKPKIDKGPSAATPPSAAKTPEGFPILATPPGVPDALRLRADYLLGLWVKGSAGNKELAREFEALGTEIVPYLSLLLEQAPKSVPVGAIGRSLAALADPRAVSGLGVALRDAESADDRKLVLAALLKLGVPETEPHVLNALNDITPDVWRLAKDYLVDRFRKRELQDLPETLAFRMSTAENKLPYALTLGGLDNQTAHRELLALLSVGDEFDQRAAVQGLSINPVADDGPHVARVLLNHRDRMLQQEACLYVGKSKYAAAVPDLILLLKEGVAGLTANAHWALKEITGEKLSAQADLWERWFEGSALKKELQK